MRTGRLNARGAVLVLCLFLLVALSLLGLAAASDQQLQEQINGNVETARQDEEIARLGSLWAQAWLAGLPGETPPPVCGETCPEGAVILAAGSVDEAALLDGPEWWQANAHRAGIDPLTGTDFGMPGLSGSARAHWLVEQLRDEAFASDGESATIGWYRILARGSNGLQGTAFTSESLFARPWGDAAWRSDEWPGGDANSLCALVPEQAACGRLAWRELP